MPHRAVDAKKYKSFTAAYEMKATRDQILELKQKKADYLLPLYNQAVPPHVQNKIKKQLQRQVPGQVNVTKQEDADVEMDQGDLMGQVNQKQEQNDNALADSRQQLKANVDAIYK